MVILGRPFSAEVQAQDRFGHGTRITQGGQQVVIELGLGASPTAGSLGGQVPDSVMADSDGNATFEGLNLDISGQYALRASVPGVRAIPAVDSPFFSAIAPPPLVDAGP
jgi:hypothetical protein